MHSGLYEQILTRALEESLGRLGDPRLYALGAVDPDDAHSALAQFLERILAECFARYRGADVADQQKRLVDRILSTLAEELGAESNGLSIASPLQRLLAIYRAAEERRSDRPDTPLTRSALLTGTRLDPSLGSQLRAEIATADRVDILCSFVKWSGLRLILDPLRELASRDTQDGPRIRLITTSYMGATDPKAIEEVSRLPNTEIRVSYDTKRTRLHAKAYVFHRLTGFGSGYVGSANLSNAALSEGLEWTTKISHFELPYLWNKIVGTFETYWEDDEFEPFHGDAPERLRRAIRSERATASEPDATFAFDLHPYPFQDEILDVLAAEREVQNKFQHLVVAATGTGKTMIAAFDYLRVSRASGTHPRLLFVAHREEILRQALGTFRAVLRDQNFGDLLVGGFSPEQNDHLFCSIQSYNSQELWTANPDHFEYVVVDEFHHAAAPSYRRLLDHVQPKVLLGLTATPERTDQLDVLHWFGGRSSAEIRLPDAINRRLLCPFQYFGVADSVDLDGLAWSRGGYRIEDLDRIYTGNDLRAQLIVEKVHEILLSPQSCRGIGFCVSVAHAEFMARFFDSRGIPAIALTAASADEARRAAYRRLCSREVNFVFVVDLYNEGVDIPEVDTLLFLRPTESLTVYLQQFGRGLRLHAEKECLTVLDFIGAQRAEFRFAGRFRALSGKPEENLEREIEHGFPHLPSGCAIQLERVAQQRILQNIRQSIRLQRSRLVGALRDLSGFLGRTPSIAEFLPFVDCSLDELLKRGLWSRLVADAGLSSDQSVVAPDEERLARGIRRLAHVDCARQIRRWNEMLEGAGDVRDVADARLRDMLYVTLWGDQGRGWSAEFAQERLLQNPAAVADIRAVLEFRLSQIPAQPLGTIPQSGPLTIHAQYTRDEILVGLGHWSLEHRPSHREGVLHLAASKVDALFVTLQKTEDEYSPTTMYEDYLISHDHFHWQSQSTTSADSNTGQRYVRQRLLGYTPLLFVRETKELAGGLSAPYAYLGPCDYESHQGSRPMSIVWKLRYEVPARLFRRMARQAVG